MSNHYAIILCGGSGTRLWPLSRTLRPKQLLPLNGEQTLLQQTTQRLLSHVPAENLFTVTHEDHKFEVKGQLGDVAPDAVCNVLAEPCARNTLPAIAWAVNEIVEKDPEAIIGVFASDHAIDNQPAFVKAWEVAEKVAEKDYLVLLGIKPHEPATGYGYIKPSKQIVDGDLPVYEVAQFVEKPDLATAEQYVADSYLWNSGMFVLGARSYMNELQRFSPEIAASCEAAMQDAKTDKDFLRPSAAFLDSPADSIDFAIMEKTDKAMVVPVDFGWNDIGAWDAIYDESERDDHGNHLRGDVIAVDTSNSLVLSSDRLVGTLGLDNLVIVDTSDAVLVADRDRVQDVKAIVAQLSASDRDEPHYHSEVFRPWGSYEGLVEGERYQVKCIKVSPGAALSLQLHHHRSEHWIVVKGTGRITRGDETFTLGENESTYIPRGVKHRLENPGKLELELIEVQVGSYLGEDDIERFDDAYGR